MGRVRPGRLGQRLVALFNENTPTFLKPLVRALVKVTWRQAQHVHPLAGGKALQKNFSAIMETDRIAIVVRFGAALDKGHFFLWRNAELSLQVLGHIA